MKENRAFRILVITKKNHRLCMEFSWKPNTKYTEVPQYSISIHPFSDVPSFSKISQPPDSFHISLISLELYFSPECLFNFVEFMVFTFLESALNLSRQNFLKICFPQQQKGLEKIMIRFIKIQSENTKMTLNNR